MLPCYDLMGRVVIDFGADKLCSDIYIYTVIYTYI
jgi:hypothetical protein